MAWRELSVVEQRLMLVAVAALAAAGIAGVALFRRQADPPPAFAAAAGLPTRPDPAKTPGAVVLAAPEVVCERGYAGGVRDVPQSAKDRVFERYGIPPGRRGDYVIDHLVPLTIGGCNSVE